MNLRDVGFAPISDDLEEQMVDAIASALGQDKDLRNAILDLSFVTWRDYGSLPWASAFSRVCSKIDSSKKQTLCQMLVREAVDGEQKGGAALLLITALENHPSYPNCELYDIYRRTNDEFVQYIIGGYLLSKHKDDAVEKIPELEKKWTFPPKNEREAFKDLLRTKQYEDISRLVRDQSSFMRTRMLRAFFSLYDEELTIRDELQELILKWLVAQTSDEISLALDILLDSQIRQEIGERHLNRPLRLVENLLYISHDPGVIVQAQTVKRMFMDDNYSSSYATQGEHICEDESKYGSVQMVARHNADNANLSDSEREAIIRVWEKNERKEFNRWLPDIPPDDPDNIVFELGKIADITLPVNLVGVANQLGIAVEKVRFNSSNFEGALLRAPNRIPAVIVVNQSGKNEGRQRFTIAHEIGHFILHNTQHQIYCSSTDINETDSNDPREQEASEFAACLLMPRRDIAKDAKMVEYRLDELQQLTDKYNVSLTALVLRLVKEANAHVCVLLSEEGSIKYKYRRQVPQLHSEWIPETSVTAQLARSCKSRLQDELDACVWFRGTDANADANVFESACKVHGDTILTLLEVYDKTL